MIGQTLDRYTIESKLGEGGMGVVYKARDTHLDRTVAIKVLPQDTISDPDRKRRFLQEARAASALNHPGIVTVHDVRSDAGIDFIVMEYVAGRTLDQIIPPTGLRVPLALRYGAAIADAIAKAHEAGIVHRDLKPSNVMVTDDDRVKILDFGLAKLFDPSEGTDDFKTRAAALTEVGTVVGTAAYMSPEQAEGRKVDGRSDVFSFGSVLYEMVTGQRPFVGESRLSVLAKILNEDPLPPSRLSASVSPELDKIILRCLRKDPSRRYQTMADLKVALDDIELESAAGNAVVQARSGSEQTARRRPERMWKWAAAVGVPLVIAGGYVATRTSPPADSAAPLRAVPLVSLPGAKGSPSFSADGNQVAFSWTGPQQDNKDVYVQQIGTGSPLRLTTDPADDYSPMWSPDGRLIAFLRQAGPARHELRVIPPLGGPDRKVADILLERPPLRPIALGWCPDSSCIVVTDSQGASKADALFAVAVESGEKRRLTTPQSTVFMDRDPAVSPDGKWLVFIRDVTPLSGEMYRVPLGGNLTVSGEPTRLAPNELYAYNPRWTPDGAGVLFSAKSGLWRLEISDDVPPTRLAFVGEDGQTPMVSRTQPGQSARMIYVRSFVDMNIWRVNTSGPGAASTAPPVVAIASTRRDLIPQLSPDARQVAFMSNRSGELEVWRADPTGANPVQLTSLGAIPGFPRWSPDGESIAFHSNVGTGAGDILVIPAGGGKPRNLTNHAANDVFPSFSRDGRWIYFSSTRGDVVRIWKVPASGGEAVQVSDRPGLLGIESTDGADLYFVDSSGTDQPGPLMRMPVTGGTAVKVVENVVATSFEVLDGGIYYIEQAAGESTLRYFDFVSRRSTVVARNLGTLSFGLAASRDGRVILYSRVDSSADDLMLVENFR